MLSLLRIAHLLQLTPTSHSLRQSMKAKKATPTGIWSEESTVFADVEAMELGGSSVRVYDCAGQVKALDRVVA